MRLTKNECKYFVELTCGRYYTLQRSKRTKYVKRILSLPETSLNLVRKYITRHKIVSKSCHENSVLFSLHHPSVKTVHGFYGEKVSMYMLLSLLPVGISPDTKGLIKIDKRTYIDLGRRMLYGKHSWNEIDGIPIDLTIELRGLDKWINYYPLETVDFKKMRNSKYYSVFKQVLEYNQNMYEMDNCFVLNNLHLKSAA
jgi:hypothetical protein